MRRCLPLSTLIVLLPALVPAADREGAPRQESRGAQHDSSRVALTEAARLVVEPGEPRAPLLTWTPLVEVTGAVPRAIVVGFTGGVERHDSRVSGVVRLREALDSSIVPAELVSMTFNNFRWRRAATEVLALVGDGQPRAGAEGATDTALWPQPLILVYGHSWGAGSIAKFARLLRDEGLEISLAVYIDAVAVRNPRVPDNVRHAVNFYQRTGLLRGLPLRGKAQLVAEAPEATALLGNYRLTPETDHFGWNWNLIQPLLYRHHHRISHDVRLHYYLIDALGVLLQSRAAPGLPAPLTVARDRTP